MKTEDIRLKAEEVEENLIEVNIGKLGYIKITRSEDKKHTVITVYKEIYIENQIDPIIDVMQSLYVCDDDMIIHNLI